MPLTVNEFRVTGPLGDDDIVILNPPRTLISTERALYFAAWIVALADPLGNRFQEIQKEVRET